MIRFFVKTVYFLVLLLLLLFGCIAFLIGTTSGLHTLIQLSRAYVPGSLIINHSSGSLIKDLSLQGVEYRHENIVLKVDQLNVQWYPNPSSFKKHELALQWNGLQGVFSGKNIQSKSGTLTGTANLPSMNLSLNAKLNTSPSEHWQLNTLINGVYPWQWTLDAHMTDLQNTNTHQPGLHTNLSARGMLKANNQGTLVLTVHPGYYQTPENPDIPLIQFKGGTINFSLSPQALIAKGILAIDSQKNLKLNLQLPGYTLDKRFNPKQKLGSDLSLEINSLDFLQNITPDISQLKGQLLALLKVTGTLGKPLIESQLLLSKSSLSVPKIGLNLDAINIDVRGKEKKWEATGTVTSAGHHLNLKGFGTLDRTFNGNVLINGTNFPLIKTSEYQVNISPQITLHVTPAIRELTGSILIPEAQIKPQTFSNSISLPDEVVFKKSRKEVPSSPFGMNINIELGKKIELGVKGLKGHISGTLNVKQQPQGPINAYGELSINDGTYKAYGQELTIQQGELVFTGGPITNPGINLRAAKKINNTPDYTSASQMFDFNTNNLQNTNFGDSMILGVEVTGRLTSPKIQLFSEPAILSQADILSMLVLGRPANQANKAGGQLLLAAISSMNVGGTNTTQLLEQLKQSSGLDFNVQTNTNYNQATNTVTDSTSFVVGKSLSKRLYLSYNIGLSQTDTNMLTLKYILNRFFSIQISDSVNSSAIDVLYTSNKKKHKPHPVKVKNDTTGTTP